MSFFSKLSKTIAGKARRETSHPVQSTVKQAPPQELIVAAKEEAIRIRTAAEEEARKLRQELVDLEKRLAQKEEVLESRTRSIESKEAEITVKLAEIEKIKEEQLTKLQKISNFSIEEAREKILAAVEERSRNEAGKLIRNILDEAKIEAATKAREILVTEMMHGATDYVAEYTVSSVSVPSEEVKGRIIGKEGRNIRSFEKATGVDVELDEEGVIRLSSFDSVRREIARVALERLIRDTRIQPARIEEVITQVKKEIDRIISDEGVKLCQSVGVYNLPQPIADTLGKFKYRFSYGQNMIVHTQEETRVGMAIAAEIGADVNIVRLGCLLHDIGKVIDSEEGSHVTLGAQYLRKFNIPEKVIACVEEHHEDRPFSSVESMIVYLADAISGSRPGARYEDLEKYLSRMKQLEEICKGFAGVSDAWVFQAGREVRVLVSPEQVTDNEAAVIALKIKEKIDSEIKEFPGQIKITVIRELRVTETAK